MANRQQVEKDIKEYCNLNGISDIESFTTTCMMRGLAIFKYGTSPVDNIKRQNEKPQEQDKKEEPVVVKKRKKITVTKKDTDAKAD